MEYTEEEIEIIKAKAHDLGWRRGIIFLSTLLLILIFALIITH